MIIAFVGFRCTLPSATAARAVDSDLQPLIPIYKRPFSKNLVVYTIYDIVYTESTPQWSIDMKGTYMPQATQLHLPLGNGSEQTDNGFYDVLNYIHQNANS